MHLPPGKAGAARLKRAFKNKGGRRRSQKRPNEQSAPRQTSPPYGHFQKWNL